MYHIHIYIYNNLSHIQICPHMFILSFSPLFIFPIKNVCWGRSHGGPPLDKELKELKDAVNRELAFPRDES